MIGSIMRSSLLETCCQIHLHCACKAARIVAPFFFHQMSGREVSMRSQAVQHAAQQAQCRQTLAKRPRSKNNRVTPSKHHAAETRGHPRTETMHTAFSTEVSVSADQSSPRQLQMNQSLPPSPRTSGSSELASESPQLNLCLNNDVIA